MMFRTVFIAASVLLYCWQVQASPGFRQMTVSDTKGDPLKVAVWYPAIQNGVSETVGENVAFVGVEIIRNARPVSGTHPLVVISHGFNGSWKNLSWLAAALAAQGYIVAAPDHPGTTIFNQNPEDARKLWRRPGEISRVIDFVGRSSDLSGTVDDKRIAAIGHSLGGWTVMSLAGARFDPSLFLNDCQQHVLRGDCKLTTKLGIDDVTAHKLLSSDNLDTRIKAVVSLDAGLAPGFTPASLSKINIPVLILAASNDKLGQLPASEESEYLADKMRGSLRQFSIIKGATHFSFMQLCKPGAEKLIDDETPGDGIVCQDDKGASRSELHQLITTKITLFLDSALSYHAPADEID
ncbi:alpha/beta fold hydrolase [Pantoea agglomerans]|uniref:alpha/beta hydrolase family protein n=1 Tax=Enterobacter agglomerans TaxID=549 RepID=UPI0012AE05C7|nr:alpha/beta fold hydrolase [Pantoea agglomerans]